MSDYEANDLSQALFEEAGDALFLFEPDSDRLVDANPMAQRLSGYTRQELLRLQASYLFRSEAKGGLNRLRQAAQRTGNFHSQDGYFLRTRHDNVWVPVNLTLARLHVQPRTLSLITARDVREQRQAQDALRESQRALSTLLSNLPGMVYRCRNDRCWTIEFASDGCLGLTGYQAADLVGNRTVSFAQLVHPDDQALVWDAVQAAVRERRPYQLTYRIRTADGTEKWVWEQGQGILNTGGEVQALEGFITDVTERKLADEALARERDLLHSLMDNVPDLIYLKDAASRFTRVNRAHAAYLGLHDPEEAVGKSDFDFYSEDEARSYFADEQRLLAEGHAVINKLEMQPRDEGPPRWILTTKVPIFGPDQGISGLIGVSRDITDRREAEQALARERALLRSLIDAVPDLVFFKDREGVYLGCNTAFARFAGRTEKEVIGSTDFDFLSRELANFYRAKDRQVLADGKPRRDEEWVTYPDGGQVLVETVQTPFQGQDGQVWGIICMSRDITERKKLEEQLRQAQKMEAVGQLAGGVAHDFNNLLTAILGNVSLLLSNKATTDPDHELLAATEQAAQRATDLTRQLLGFSRQTVLRLEPLNLNSSVQEVVSMLRRTIDPRVTIEVHPTADPWWVQGDAGQMNQVLVNLCLNARDAMADGGRLTLETANVRLDEELVRTQLEARAGEFVRLRVGDTGCGIPDEVRTRIFEPFFTTKGPGKGTGLGLAMVYGIIQQHQGWIECLSEVGKGTYFDIYIPRYRVEGARPDRAAPVSTTPRGNETVLLVDDEAVIRNVGRAILQRQGYHVLLAEDGLEALELFRRERGRINLVVLDLTMPRLSGLDTLRQLVQLDPEIAVLLSSGYSAEQLPEIGTDGVRGFVNKPYRPQDLIAAVRSALDRTKERPKDDNQSGMWVI
jgi:PAS domain S-box-containing protein